MDYTSISSCVDEYATLTAEFKDLEDVHKRYLQKLDELHQARDKCQKQIAHHKYRMTIVSKSANKLMSDARKSKKTVVDAEDRRRSVQLRADMARRRTQLADMEEFLPRENGRYLRIILGCVNVSLMNREDRYNYKDEYEKFKLVITAIGFLVSLTNLTLFRYRFMDMALMFLLVWYYCTLTIRESILKVNGSKIKGWWRTHHILSAVASGVLLTWPDSRSYHEFRHQFLIFNCYISLVQFLQFRYQQGTIYRLKALGERHNMDITIEGFHSWMWRGLSFLLPFLFIGYLFQLHNSYRLYEISRETFCTEWQVSVLSVLFFVIFLGNVITTSWVIPQKLLNDKTALANRYATAEDTKTSNRTDSE